MSLLPPYKTEFIEDKSDQRRLVFDYPSGTDTGMLPINGDYIIVSSVTWPRYNDSGDGYYGYSLLSIKSVKSGIIYIIEERKFETIDNIIDPDTGDLKKRGFASFCEYLKDKYLWNKFYCDSDKDISRRYIKQVKDSKFITEPKPLMIPSRFKDYEKCISDIYEMLSLGKLFYKSDLNLFNKIREMQIVKTNKIPQSIEALSYILMALEYK